MMNKQQYYDKLVEATYDGTFPSNKAIQCLYRKDSTAECKQRCAVGLLIPDGKFDPAWNMRSIGVDSVMAVVKYFIPEGMTINDLREVQLCHDGNAWPQWRPEVFLEQLNSLRCFLDVVKSEVMSLKEADL